ncbi:MAG: hypothetical protein LBV08_00445, partial [Clostridiales bacterium]|nr:hypothetical protein [Clostridiales bacterium]
MKKIILNNIYIILFSSAIVMSLLTALGMRPFFFILTISLSCLVFLLCGYAQQNPKIGGFSIFLLSLAICAASYYLIDKNSSVFEFIIVLKYRQAPLEFQMIVLVGGIFLISVIAYYFSNIAYHSYIYYLFIFFSVICFETRGLNFPSIYVFSFVILYIAVIIDTRRKRVLKEPPLNYPYSVAQLCLFIFIFVLFAPDTKKTPYPLAAIFNLGANSSDNFASSNRVSGKNYSNLDDKELFTLSADSNVYLKRQVFGDYEGAENQWVYVQDDGLRKGSNIEVDGKINFEQKFLTPEIFAALLERACLISPSLKEKGYGEYASLLKNAQAGSKTAIIHYTDFASYTLPAPVGTYRLSGLPYETYKNPIGEVFSLDFVPNKSFYNIEYFDFKQSEEAKIVSQSISFETYKEIINDMGLVYGAAQKENELKIVSFFKEETDNISKYISLKNHSASEKTVELAKKITAGKTSDYEKALAIQNYFHMGNFLYDLDYKPPAGKESNDYFLFESKRGTCSDFATAMVLMGKSAGLIIRYTEGFLPEPAKNGYSVSSKNSHAYPEVYIAGYGWVVFEPTVSTVANNISPLENYFSKFKSALGFGIIAFIVFSLLLIISKALFLPAIKEQLFRHKVRASRPSKAIILIYGKLAQLAQVKEN